MKLDSKLKADIKMIQMRNFMDPKRYVYTLRYHFFRANAIFTTIIVFHYLFSL